MVVLAFIVGLVLGAILVWFFYCRRQTSQYETRIHSLQTSLDAKEQSLQSSRMQLKELESRARDAEAMVAELEASLAEKERQSIASQLGAMPSRATESALPVSEPKRDNLQRIEGIGPKISQVLQTAGISTFAQLAATDVGRLEQILNEAAMTLADPATWPEQAKLAAASDWRALDVLQDELKGGRRT
jgi:predicted flap endonuclease-1-like 5' DNA nuclease